MSLLVRLHHPVHSGCCPHTLCLLPYFVCAPHNSAARLCRPDFVIDTTFELFCELGASDEQCDFPAVYASGVNGTAGMLPHSLADDLEPLFEAIVKEIQPPAVKLNSPLQMLVTNLDYDDHKGRIAIGRVSSGCISKAEQVSYLKPGTMLTLLCMLSLKSSCSVAQVALRILSSCLYCLALGCLREHHIPVLPSLLQF